MTTSEFRIGNLGYYRPSGSDAPFHARVIGVDLLTVLVDYKSGRTITAKANPGYDFHGIPLTEEWCSKFGFERHINEYQIDGIEMKYQIDDKTWLSSCGKHGGGLVVLCLCRGNYFANNLRYVHQLQNLVYAITNEELSLVDQKGTPEPS